MHNDPRKRGQYDLNEDDLTVRGSSAYFGQQCMHDFYLLNMSAFKRTSPQKVRLSQFHDDVCVFGDNFGMLIYFARTHILTLVLVNYS